MAGSGAATALAKRGLAPSGTRSLAGRKLKGRPDPRKGGIPLVLDCQRNAQAQGYGQVFALAFASSELAFFRHGTGRTASLWTFAVGHWGRGFEVLSRHACAPKDLVAHTHRPAHHHTLLIAPFHMVCLFFTDLPLCGTPHLSVSAQNGTDNAARHNGRPG